MPQLDFKDLRKHTGEVNDDILYATEVSMGKKRITVSLDVNPNVVLVFVVLGPTLNHGWATAIS